ncbi:MAG: phosphatidate cytidylyltransferase [Acidobacteria bacterium]|nr:phosphatidate cytidylyltransferase [Acidobacteriota bacterium]
MTRVLSGAAMAGVAVALIWFLTPVALLVVALVVAALAFVEYARIVNAIGATVPWWTSLAATLGACAMVPFPWVSVEVVIVVGLIGMAANVLASDRVGPPTLADTAAAVLAPVYIGLPLGALVAIAALAGREAVLVLMGTVAASDTAQYYTGRLFGRHPLAPLRSPKKTIEGALGGFVVAPAVLVAAGSAWLPGLTPWRLVVLGVLIVTAGIIGDLFESMLKRAAGMKDSGHLIPGHGGVLDRIDALLFAAPVFYFFVR